MLQKNTRLFLTSFFLLLICGFFLSGCSQEKKLPVLGQLPSIEFVDHEGKPFSSERLKDKAWVSSFVFTRCAGPCPMMTAHMKFLKSKVPATEDLLYVSISVDPHHDSPAVLKQYAENLQAGEGWYFVTGDKDVIYELSNKHFMLGVTEDENEKDVNLAIVHSTRFSLVDGDMQIRGYYDGQKKGEVLELAEDAEQLRREAALKKARGRTPLPAVNASLNGLSALFLLAGFLMIKRGKVQAHRICMGTALLSSAVFLSCYLYYHHHFGSTSYTGQGWMRTVYFTILISHTILATLNVPMILKTVWHALRREDAKHRRIARITFPIWMYVSVTGVIIYLMLYH